MLRIYWSAVVAPAFFIGLVVAVLLTGIVAGYLCGREYLREVFDVKR